MMRSYRGIVCEKNKKDMIFITDKGEFLRGIPLVSNPEIGDEVEFNLVATTPLLKKKLKPYFILPALVAALLTIFLVASVIPKTNSAYAYIHIKGDNSLELTMDKNGNVVSVQFNNEKSINGNEDWKGLPIEKVLSKAIEQVAPQNEKVEISTDYEDKFNIEMKEQIEKVVNDISNEYYEDSSTNKKNTSREKSESENSNSKQSIKERKQEQYSPINEYQIDEKEIEQSPKVMPKENQTVSNQSKAENARQNNSTTNQVEKTTPISKNTNANKVENKKDANSSASQNKNQNSNNNNQNNSNNDKNREK